MLGSIVFAILGVSVAVYGLLMRRRERRERVTSPGPSGRFVILGIAVTVGATAAAFHIAKAPPVRYKVWTMRPFTCSDTTLSGAAADTMSLRICLDSAGVRGRAAPLLRAALRLGTDSAPIGSLAESAAKASYRRAAATKRLDDLRETVDLAQFADSVRASRTARFVGAVAAYHAALLLKDVDECAAARDAAYYLEIAAREPFRADVAMEPDTMRTAREIQSALAQARDRAKRLCSTATQAR